MERLEGQAARGPVSCDAGAAVAARRRARTSTDSVEGGRSRRARQLRLYAVPDGAELQLWNRLDSVYFQRHSADEIAWHARQLYFRVDEQRARGQGAPFARRRRIAGDDLPSRPERAVRANLRIFRSRASVDTRSQDPHDAARLRARHVRRARPCQSERRLPRSDQLHRVRAEACAARRAAARTAARSDESAGTSSIFRYHPKSGSFPDDKGTHYILEIVAGDRPGLLARIAYTLASANINVASARINTLGERAEDVFLIDGARLHDKTALLRLETALYEQLRLN